MYVTPDLSTKGGEPEKSGEDNRWNGEKHELVYTSYVRMVNGSPAMRTWARKDYVLLYQGTRYIPGAPDRAELAVRACLLRLCRSRE